MPQKRNIIEVYCDNDDLPPSDDNPQARMIHVSADGGRIWETPRSPQKPKRNAAKKSSSGLKDFDNWGEFSGGGGYEDGDKVADAVRERVVIKPHAKRYANSVCISLLLFFVYLTDLSRTHLSVSGQGMGGGRDIVRNIFMSSFDSRVVPMRAI